jgi:DNA polymerase IV (DinB-like DNA polymerase)
MQARVIMLVDFDYFFAQCEELRNPSLKDKPLVVGVYSGRTEYSGAVSTANYIAREYGVTSGIPLYLAKKRLDGTEAVFLPTDNEFYEQISKKVMKTLRGYADSFEQTSIDEAYLDVTKKVNRSYETARELAQKIKNNVKNDIGISLSVGIGPNKLLAKIAADSQKPNGLTIIKPWKVESFLSPLPVNRLIGVGRKTTLKMGELGIKTVGELANYEVQKIVDVFGKKLGVYFHNSAKGVDNMPVQETGESESISRISTLKENTRDLTIILEKATELIEDIHKDIVRRNISFKQIGIIAIMIDLKVRSRSKTMETATSDVKSLRGVVRELFEKLLRESELEIRRVGVKISTFANDEVKQKKLTSFIQET